MQTANLFQTAATSIQDDVSSCSRLIAVSRQNNGNLVGGVCRQVIAAVICLMIKVKGDLALLVWSHVLSELKGLFAQLYSWMTAVKHVLKGLHGRGVEGCVGGIVHTKIQGFLWIINVKLGIDGR